MINTFARDWDPALVDCLQRLERETAIDEHEYSCWVRDNREWINAALIEHAERKHPDGLQVMATWLCMEYLRHRASAARSNPGPVALASPSPHSEDSTPSAGRLARALSRLLRGLRS